MKAAIAQLLAAMALALLIVQIPGSGATPLINTELSDITSTVSSTDGSETITYDFNESDTDSSILVSDDFDSNIDTTSKITPANTETTPTVTSTLIITNAPQIQAVAAQASFISSAYPRLILSLNMTAAMASELATSTGDIPVVSLVSTSSGSLSFGSDMGKGIGLWIVSGILSVIFAL